MKDPFTKMLARLIEGEKPRTPDQIDFTIWRLGQGSACTARALREGTFPRFPHGSSVRTAGASVRPPSTGGVGTTPTADS